MRIISFIDQPDVIKKILFAAWDSNLLTAAKREGLNAVRAREVKDRPA